MNLSPFGLSFCLLKNIHYHRGLSDSLMVRVLLAGCKLDHSYGRCTLSSFMSVSTDSISVLHGAKF